MKGVSLAFDNSKVFKISDIGVKIADMQLLVKCYDNKMVKSPE